MLPIPDRETDVSSAFLTFMRHAAAGRQNGIAESENCWFDAASRLWPLDEQSLDMFTGTLIDRHRHGDAIELAAIIAQLDPRRASAHFRLGYVLQMMNRHGESIAPYRVALAIDPTLPRLRNNLAGALMLTGGDAHEQRALLESAVRDEPGDGDAWTNLAHAYRMAMDIPRALDAGVKAVQCAPHSPLAHNNYALALREAQRWDDAGEAAQHACTAAPGNATMRSNLAMLQLMRGDYAAGWQSHEARWDGAAELGGRRPSIPAPTWCGEPLGGKTLLVWGEQGMGDVLQFSRYMPMLAERVHREGGRVVWNSFPQMGALLTRSFGHYVDGYSSSVEVESLAPFDYEIPLLSLPMIFDTRSTTIPSPTAYLRADDSAREAWRRKLAEETRLKVGLAWTGSVGHQRNPFRRVGWERYAAHFGAMQNVAFYSLQPGADADIAAARTAGFPIVDVTADFATFDDTAAFVSALDLVITVCTSAAHLSGALGQRTWLLLDVNPHWVWQLERKDSPWYSSARLYRQPHFGQWAPVLEEVARDLTALTAEHASHR